MSFAGHVFDMIRRDKENRGLRNRRRERRKDMQEVTLHGEPLDEQPDVTLEELEEISRRLKEREIQEQRYRSRVLLACMVIALVLLLILMLVFI